jgi:hypothetical protein
MNAKNDIFLSLNLSENQMKKHTFLYLIFTFLSLHIFSQQPGAIGKKEITTLHYYTFEANASQDRLNALEQALSGLEFVTEAKVKYKPEKGMGQVIMLVKQPVVTSENQKEFSPTIIKKTLINMGFTPVKYSTGEYTTN